MPVPGSVKTRLVPRLSPAGAAALCRAMTEDLLERLAVGFRERTAGAPALELRCDGGREPASLEIPPEWKVEPQGSGNLGERLVRAARAAARMGWKRW